MLISVNTVGEIFRKTIYLGVSFDSYYESYIALNVAVCSLTSSSAFYIEALNGTQTDRIAWQFPFNFVETTQVMDPLPALYFNTTYPQCNSSIQFDGFFDKAFRYDYREIDPILEYTTNYSDSGDFQAGVQFD